MFSAVESPKIKIFQTCKKGREADLATVVQRGHLQGTQVNLI